jgi:peptide-N4-(N-acetyl-beta-glucosaminyl)asparagine amidase
MVGYAKPTAQELRGEAGRVEEYECQQCHSRERFPRYGDPSVLLDPENRRGRCGEWANVFALMCRSLGLDTRYVVDWTDHVWTEYYSDRLGKWVHLDSCEAAFDTPLVYESGWGKKLTYCIAFSIDEAVEVGRATFERTSRFDTPTTRQGAIGMDCSG